MKDVSRLGMEFGQYVHQVTFDLLTSNPTPQSLSAMEKSVRESMLKLAQYLLSNWLALQNERYPSETRPCRCGALTHYREMREGVLFTVVGRITFRRAYYVCGTCHQGAYPLDEHLGLRAGEFSAELESLSALTGVQMPFGQGSEFFERLTLVGLSPQSMDKATQSIGREMELVETELKATSQNLKELGQLDHTEPPLERLYGALDATKVHTSEKRDADDEGWRDLKVGAWFETETHPPEQPDQPWDIQARNLTYFCDIQEAQAFGELVWATGVQRRVTRAKELIFVSDGAEWIWNLVEFYYPHAVQIVDWFHAAEHLTPVSLLAGANVEVQHAWLRQARDDLWNGRVEQVITACVALATPGRKEDLAQKAATYFTNNRQRMDYPTYRAKGYQIGSGTIESGCKQIGTQRLKVPGATWDKQSARRVAKARAAYLSGQWDMVTARRVHLPVAV